MRLPQPRMPGTITVCPRLLTGNSSATPCSSPSTITLIKRSIVARIPSLGVTAMIQSGGFAQCPAARPPQIALALRALGRIEILRLQRLERGGVFGVVRCVALADLIQKEPV